MFLDRPWLQRKVLRWLYSEPEVLVKYDYDPMLKSAVKALGYAPILRYAKAGDGGIDLYYCGEKQIVLNVGESINVPAGLSIKIPDGYVGLIRGRSSTFTRRGLFVVHNTIDSGYTGPLFSTVWCPGLNGKREAEVINPWERLSQIIIVPYLNTKIRQVDELPVTLRASSGFGSSGR